MLFKRTKYVLTAAVTACTMLLSACGSAGTASADTSSTAAGRADSAAAVSSASSAASAADAATSAGSESAAADSVVADSAESSSEVTSASVAVSYREVSDSGSTKVDTKEISNTDSSATAQSKDEEVQAETQYITNTKGRQMQIVVFGDSQFDNARDGTGIAYLVSKYCQAKIYNCAMGGTAAATLPNEERYMTASNWTSRSFMGMVMCATGKVDPSFFKSYHSYDVYESCDLSKTDVFIVEYGANDYFQKSELSDLYRQDTYVGALYSGITQLQKAYPNAKVILCAPTYAQFFGTGHKYLGDSNMTSNGIGTLYDYCCAACNVAQTMGISYMNAYDWLHMTSSNADDYLQDGLHLNENGRKVYAQMLSRIVLRTQGYTIDADTDLDTVDWKSVAATRSK
ncbi:MAG: SGNH/GDSL hydrolase family protein [Lachnospiraceae bacterium]|jgi:hypothetical protein|nr:SGNH/GDSL hydrolase family protein [Lachnospiraceae bacterium]